MWVDFRVVGASTWLRVQEDDRTVLDQGGPPGFSRRFEAGQEVRIRTGNAGDTRGKLTDATSGHLGPAAKSGLGGFLGPAPRGRMGA